MTNSKRTCVYTTLIGEYEELNEICTTKDTSIPHICITDDTSLKSNTWEIRVIEPVFPMDKVRSQRRVKLLTHEYLPEFDVSMYIDNSVRLNTPANELIEQMLENTDMAIPKHSFRASVYDEFVMVAKLGLDDAARIFEQLNHYQLTHPEILNQHPYYSGILFRRHGKPEVQEVMCKWYEHVTRYSRRDQLSLNAAMHNSKAKIKTLELDNHQSWLHTWPVTRNRQATKRQKNMMMSGAPTMTELKLLEIEIENHKSELLQLKMQIQQLESALSEARVNYDDILNSSSWKITSPLRRIKMLFR